MDFYKGVKSDFNNLKNELSEIEKIYKINRKISGSLINKSGFKLYQYFKAS
jgi:hypothetical protein